MSIDRVEYYSAIKKNKTVSSVATWIDPDSDILSEISQAKKVKCCLYS